MESGVPLDPILQSRVLMKKSNREFKEMRLTKSLKVNGSREGPGTEPWGSPPRRITRKDEEEVADTEEESLVS